MQGQEETGCPRVSHPISGSVRRDSQRAKIRERPRLESKSVRLVTSTKQRLKEWDVPLRPRSRSEGAIRATLTRTPSALSLLSRKACSVSVVTLIPRSNLCPVAPLTAPNRDPKILVQTRSSVRSEFQCTGCCTNVNGRVPIVDLLLSIKFGHDLGSRDELQLRNMPLEGRVVQKAGGAVARGIRARCPAGSLPDFRVWESCWTMPLAGGSSRFPRPCIPAPLHPRVSFEAMFGDDVSQLESPSPGERCLVLGSLPTPAFTLTRDPIRRKQLVVLVDVLLLCICADCGLPQASVHETITVDVRRVCELFTQSARRLLVTNCKQDLLKGSRWLLAYHLCEPGSNPSGGRSQIFASGNRAERCRCGWRVLSGISLFPPPGHSGAARYPPRFTLIGSQDLDVMDPSPDLVLRPDDSPSASSQRGQDTRRVHQSSQLKAIPTSVQSRSRQSACYRVLRKSSRTVAFTRRVSHPLIHSRTPRPPSSRNLPPSSVPRRT
ncbi:hypothetical protein PR048_029367 [Dryococelus australis]|uniref:Uncharacterized protein n=1 Tax=Dryococelus australis TaxID=614101 RepID=A0ABQ9GG63_9NEOP|nr:hypothetical protein PR048_029367 [Dryococelus australis]